MSDIQTLVSGAFKEASTRGGAANANNALPHGVIPFPAKLSARERRALASAILYKACTLKTTEQWVKESAERFLGVNDLYEIRMDGYEFTMMFLMNFKDENICAVNFD